MADAGGLAVRRVDDGNGNGDVGGESDEELVEDSTGSDDELVVFKRRFNPSLSSRLLTKPRGTPRPAPLSGPAGPHHARKAVPRFDLRLLPAGFSPRLIHPKQRRKDIRGLYTHLSERISCQVLTAKYLFTEPDARLALLERPAESPLQQQPT